MIANNIRIKLSLFVIQYKKKKFVYSILFELISGLDELISRYPTIYHTNVNKFLLLFPNRHLNRSNNLLLSFLPFFVKFVSFWCITKKIIEMSSLAPTFSSSFSYAIWHLSVDSHAIDNNEIEWVFFIVIKWAFYRRFDNIWLTENR